MLVKKNKTNLIMPYDKRNPTVTGVMFFKKAKFAFQYKKESERC
jgi:hypothetical protein